MGIALYDPRNKVGGLAHILLSDSSQFRKGNPFNPAKFADTAVPEMVVEMEKVGGRKGNFCARIAGGSQLFAFQKSGVSVGQKNVEAVHRALYGLGIPLVAEDIGGDHGRTMRFFVDSGRVCISSVGKGEKEI